MTAFNEWLSHRVSDADSLLFNTVVVPVSPNISLGAMDLLRAWWEHLSKFTADLSVPPGDRSIWGAHDYIAALILRDRLAAAISRVDPTRRYRIESVVAEIDQLFMDFTEPDNDGCIERVDGRQDSSRGWWWKRVPARGPVRAELRIQYGHETNGGTG
ncbi:hypothetical protein [Micromonospora sp. DT229]|uniref:hypothetical protein n=1 Tax=Micromonospora sp. DT229 TaxID=3393430 RepID=UPI003CEAF91A